MAKNSIGGRGRAAADRSVSPHVSGMRLVNFKKFSRCDINLDPSLNILAGDNEVGKSTVLLAIDLALGGSRTRVEAIGVETLLHKDAVRAFQSGAREVSELPTLFVELYLEGCTSSDLHGRTNSRGESTFGLRMAVEPSDDYLPEIRQVLADSRDSFPYEFYAIKFLTFSGAPYAGFRRYLSHIHIDSAAINAEHAQRDYTRALFRAHATVSQRGTLESKYRGAKEQFTGGHLEELVPADSTSRFSVRTSSKSNLESDLVIVEEGVSLENRGRGRQALVKTDFALRRGKTAEAINVILLEEPENHLSHVNMRRLVDSISGQKDKQVIIATHSSMIASRLDLRHALLFDSEGRHTSLNQVDEETADFFCKAPSNNLLAFAMAKRVLLVEGDAEFILISALFQLVTGKTLEAEAVQVISVGGTSFKRYLSIANILKIRTAVLRDNDGNYQVHCVENYEGYLSDNAKVFADPDPARSTFEICVYQDNAAICEAAFSTPRRKLSIQDYMLSNKAEAALGLLKKHAAEIKVPTYIAEALAWIRG